MIAGRPAGSAEVPATELAALVSAREQAGQGRKEAIAEVAATTGVAKRLVFDAVVSAKRVI